MCCVHPEASFVPACLQRLARGKARFLILCLALVSLSAPAQEVLPTPAPALYGSGIAATMVQQADGKVIVAGPITQASGQSVRYLARYHADGSLDDTYAPALDGWVEDMQLDSQGRLYVMLRATQNGNSTVPATGFQFVRRIHESGQIDESFVPPAPANTYDDGFAILVDEDGGALYASYAVLASPYNHVVVRRYSLADGSLDAGFQLQVSSLIADMVRHEEQIVLTGWFSDVNGTARKGLARVNRFTGALDESWNPGATVAGSFTGRALLLDGTHVLVGSNGQNLGGGTNRGLARISLADGSADPAWNTLITGTVYALARDSQARIVVFGSLSQIAGAPWSRSVTRFSAGGQHEVAWGDPSERVGNSMKEVLVLPGDDVLTAQSGNINDSMPRLLRHANDTGVATEFAASLLDAPKVSRAFGVAGDTLLTGPIFSIDESVGVGAVRLDADGAGVPGWRSNYGSSVDWIQAADAAVSSEHLYLTGFISPLNSGPNYFPVRRLSLADGTLDTSWNPQMLYPGSAGSHRVALDEAAGFVYVYGSNLSGDPTNRQLARFDMDDGTLDASWGPGLFSSTAVSQIASVDGFLYVAGGFTTIGGVDLPRLARIPISGSGVPDAGWRPAPDVAISAMAFDEVEGWIYAGGGGASGIELSRYRLSDGSRDTEWSPLAGRAGSITRLVLDALGGSLYVIGDLGVGCGGDKLSVVRLYSGPTRLDPLWRVEFDRYGAAADVLPHTDGSALVVGYFSRINGQSRQSLAAVGKSDSIYADGMGTGDNAGGCVQ